MADEPKRVLFDASDFPEFEGRKRKQMKTVTLILITGTVGTPAIFAFVWFWLEVVVNASSILDPILFGIVLIIVTVLDEFAMLRLVRPALTKPWKFPTRVTNEGLEIGGKITPAGQLEMLILQDFSVAVKTKGRRVTLFPPLFRQSAHDAFAKALREISPAIEIQDKRKGRSV